MASETAAEYVERLAGKVRNGMRLDHLEVGALIQLAKGNPHVCPDYALPTRPPTTLEYERLKLALTEAVLDANAAGGNDEALSAACERAERALDAYVGSLMRATREPESGEGEIHGVTFLILNDDRVLLERCPKKREVLGVGEWFIPGGKVESGEKPYDAMVREVKEELGVRVVHAHPLPIVEGSPIPPTERGLFLMRPYLVLGAEGDTIPYATVDGDVPLRWVPISEALHSPVPQVRMMVAAAVGALSPSPQSEPEPDRAD